MSHGYSVKHFIHLRNASKFMDASKKIFLNEKNSMMVFFM